MMSGMSVATRVYARPTSNESAVHVAILEWIRAVAPDAMPIHVPNEGKRTTMAGVMAKRLGMVKGVPDLIVFFPHARVLFIEVKDRGAVSKEQRAFGQAVQALGFHWSVCRSIDDARNTFRAIGIQTREAAQ